MHPVAAQMARWPIMTHLVLAKGRWDTRRVGELDAIERSWFATGFWLDSPVVADPLLRVNKWNQDGLWWGEMAGDGDSHLSLTKQVFVYKQTAQKRHPGGTLLRATPPERPME